MRMKIFTLVFLLSGVISNFLFANNTKPNLWEIKRMNPKKVIAKADALFAIQDYTTAYYYYLAYSQQKKFIKRSYVYRLGKTALYAGDIPMARIQLKRVLHKYKKFPLVTFEYAKVLKLCGEYESAMNFFSIYIKLNKTNKDNDYLGLCKKHISSCSNAIKSKKTAEAVAINAASILEDSSFARSISAPSNKQYRLMEIQTPKGNCIYKITPNTSVEKLNSSLSDPIFNSGAPHIAPDGESVYFTRLELTALGEQQYHIFMGRITDEGEVIEVRKLGPSINREGFSSRFPCIGITKHGQHILYFASTLPGGQGGFDIWYSIKMDNGDFTTPYNLGASVNTTFDELSPFYFQADNQLYFSSDSPEGFGGQDIFSVEGEKKRWDENKKEHLPYPYNSEGNDTGLVKDKNGDVLMSSDRGTPGSSKIISIQPKEKKDKLPVITP